MIKKAMILAAGFGKRLHPLTLTQPKPLLKIGNQTLLSNTLKFIELFGIKEVVVNVHYLREQISDYVKKKKFNLNIKIIEEKEKILDTGGGVLNAIKYFNDAPFLVLNPDTIWSTLYLKELKKLEESFLENKSKCSLLVVHKEKSFDKSIKGDFNLKNNLISRKEQNFKYIYTGLQIIKPDVFSNIDVKIFSINKIWNELILKNQLHANESNINFFHVSTFEIFKKILEKKLDIK